LPLKLLHGVHVLAVGVHQGIGVDREEGAGA
jgi:hypothetical protein